MTFWKINILLHFLPSTLKQLLCGDEAIIKDELIAHVWDDTSSSYCTPVPLAYERTDLCVVTFSSKCSSGKSALWCQYVPK